MLPGLLTIIEEKLRLEWSPEQISGWLLEAKCILIGHESICQHLRANKRQGGILYTHLRRKNKCTASAATENPPEDRLEAESVLMKG